MQSGDQSLTAISKPMNYMPSHHLNLTQQ